ncbi:SRPBCC family protein [Williamsia sp. CHRR-6]|uniref:type II toxin-antitoxin system Rv0910 family toxin n=1 Tax=Williamsia sp. CHRR-6 TaxID=2835871 RepID=UPI001BDB355E|nr:SRPBCC family protein [Williamsia sp. CHRR-6]MBT0566517.1 SRPBCC family protein [Williamsia sp. CHRR-6]
MASVKDSVTLTQTPDEAWNHVSDLTRFDEWLTIHDGWRSAVPAPGELEKGLEVVSVVSVKGTRVRVQWVIDVFDPPRTVTLIGNGKGGVKIKLALKVRPEGSGSQVEFDVDMGGLPLMGPAGRVAAKMLRSDLDDSLRRFRELFDA